MNDDLLKNVEEHLAAIHPSALPPELIERLDKSMDERLSPADRVLALFAASGAIAAAVVVGLTLWQLASTPEPARGPPMNAALRQQIATEYQELLASK